MTDGSGQVSGDGSASSSLAARYGRRAAMLAAAAAGAGAAASVVGGGFAMAAPEAPLAGSAVQLGKTNKAKGTTIITSSGGIGLSGHASAKGTSGLAGFDTHSTRGSWGVSGHSVNGIGVIAFSTNATGIVGNAQTPGQSGTSGLDFCPKKGGIGVYGQSNNGDGVFGFSYHGTGVAGQGKTSGESGVRGIDIAKSGGHGVTGLSDHGIGVFATSQHGIALEVQGKMKLTNSGVATITSGNRSMKVAHKTVSSSSIVIATIQNPISGVFIEGAESEDGAFTITLSKNVGSAVKVGWFILD